MITASHGNGEVDFTKKWDMSDVALKTNCTDNLLHVNKTLLALHSPYFKTLFFSDFAESRQSIVELDVCYDHMLTILRFLHHIDRNFAEQASSVDLGHLYQAADYLDIPLVRESCKQRLLQMNPVYALPVANRLELHKEKTEILKNMTLEDIRDCLKMVPEVVFSAADVTIIIEKRETRLPNE